MAFVNSELCLSSGPRLPPTAAHLLQVGTLALDCLAQGDPAGDALSMKLAYVGAKSCLCASSTSKTVFVHTPAGVSPVYSQGAFAMSATVCNKATPAKPVVSACKLSLGSICKPSFVCASLQSPSCPMFLLPARVRNSLHRLLSFEGTNFPCNR